MDKQRNGIEKISKRRTFRTIRIVAGIEIRHRSPVGQSGGKGYNMTKEEISKAQEAITELLYIEANTRYDNPELAEKMSVYQICNF